MRSRFVPRSQRSTRTGDVPTESSVEAVLSEMGALAWFSADDVVGTTMPNKVNSSASPATMAGGTNRPKYLQHGTDSDYVNFDGVTGSYISMPDVAALDITGDIDIRVHAQPGDTSWATGLYQTFVGKYSTSNQRAYRARISNTGYMELWWSTDGATNTSAISTVITPASARYLRWTLDVDNGSGGRDAKFWTSPDQGVTWDLLDTVTVGSTTSIYASAAALQLGEDGFTGNLFHGRMYSASVRDGIDGTVVADFDASLSTQAGYTDAIGSAGGTWTLNGGAEWVSATAEDYVWFPGTTGNSVTMPDAAALDIATDLDVRVFAFPSLFVSAPAVNATIAAKYTSTGNQRSWWLRWETTRKLRLYASSDGATNRSYVSDALPATAVDAIKVEFDADNGANSVCTFYTSSDGGESWSALGSPVTDVVGGLFNSSANLALGEEGGLYLNGRLKGVEVRDGIDGTIVADFNASSCGQSGYTDTVGSAAGVWTVNRSTSGAKTVVVKKPTLLFATDDYASIPTDAWPAMTASDSAWIIAVFRQWNTAVTNGRYVSSRGGAGVEIRHSGNISASAYDASANNAASHATPPAAGTIIYHDTTITPTTLRSRVNGSTNGSASLASVGDRTGAVTPSVIGRWGGGSLYQDFELLHLVTGQGAITDAQLAKIEALLGVL